MMSPVVAVYHFIFRENAMDTKQASKLLVRLILVMLGIVALAGVALMVSGNDEVIMRLVGTAVSTLVACALVYRSLHYLNRPAMRPVAIGTIILSGVELLLVNLAIYHDLLWPGTGYRGQGILATTAAITFAVLFPCLLFLRILTLPGGRWAAYFGMGLALLAWAMFITAVWTWSVPFGYDNLLRIGVLTCLTAATVSANLFGLSGTERAWPRVLGAALAAIGLIAGSLAILEPSSTDQNRFFADLATIAFAMSVWTGFANLILRLQVAGWMRWVRHATLITAGATVILITAAALHWIHDLNDSGEEAVTRTAAAAGIVWVCLIAALLLAARFARGVEIVRSASVDHVEMDCPICRSRLSVPVTAWDPQAPGNSGGSGEETAAPIAAETDARCPTCSLIVRVQLRAPTCEACGYLLYYIKDQTCPECGAATRLPRPADRPGTSSAGANSPPPAALAVDLNQPRASASG